MGVLSLSLPCQHEFVSAMFNFFVAFNNLQLNDTEIGLFSAVVLLTNGESGWGFGFFALAPVLVRSAEPMEVGSSWR